MDKFNIEKCLLENSVTFLTIDIGISMIKCVYIDKENDNYNEDPRNNDIIFTYKSENFVHGIENLLENVKSQLTTLNRFQSRQIMISGIQCLAFLIRISQHFDCDVKIISEYEAISKGLQFIINHHEKDKFFHLPETISSNTQVESKITKKLIDTWKKTQLKNSNSENENYPLLYVSVGSFCRYILVNENGIGKDVSFYSCSGKTFQGLAKSLIDENDMNNILPLSEAGNRENIDTQIKEILDGKPDSPYGGNPPDLPIFQFGKAMDINSDVHLQFKKEDISQSLSSMILENTVFFGFRIASVFKCKTIYYGGNLFQHKTFRIEYAKFLRRLPELIKTKFLKCGAEINIGLLLCKNESLIE